MRALIIIFALINLFIGTAHAAGEFGASGFGSSETRKLGNVKKGVLLEARSVQITVEATNVAKATGGSLGATAGSYACKEQDWAIQALCGTVGGILGAIAGEVVSSKTVEGIEMIILFEQSGELVSVTQEAAGTKLTGTGDEVYVATINGTTRVFPVGGASAATKAMFRM